MKNKKNIYIYVYIDIYIRKGFIRLNKIICYELGRLWLIFLFDVKKERDIDKVKNNIIDN